MTNFYESKLSPQLLYISATLNIVPYFKNKDIIIYNYSSSEQNLGKLHEREIISWFIITVENINLSLVIGRKQISYFTCLLFYELSHLTLHPRNSEEYAILFNIFCYCSSGGFSITGTLSQGISSKVIFPTIQTGGNLKEII